MRKLIMAVDLFIDFVWKVFRTIFCCLLCVVIAIYRKIAAFFSSDVYSGKQFPIVKHPLLTAIDSSANLRRSLFFVLASVIFFYWMNGYFFGKPDLEKGDIVYGVASYYERGFIGRKTANGEIFTSKELTAAHKTLPFHTMVLLVNEANGCEVIVRINDRGPFIRGRDVDLSRAAAESLGMVREGVVEVRMQVIRD